jgi:hypothetical protein
MVSIRFRYLYAQVRVEAALVGRNDQTPSEGFGRPINEESSSVLASLGSWGAVRGRRHSGAASHFFMENLGVRGVTATWPATPGLPLVQQLNVEFIQLLCLTSKLI